MVTAQPAAHPQTRPHRRCRRMSERETLDRVTAERDFLAGLVEQHEARLRTFSADLQHVLLADQ